MSWMRNGDNAATYPKLLSVVSSPDADSRLLNEVAGWLWRCSCEAAGHETDYFIGIGTAVLLGGDRTQILAQAAVSAGLLTIERAETGNVVGYTLIDDPDFIHIVKRQEKEWERQQRNDSRDPRLKVPLLKRDGMLCRFCAVKTQLAGRPSGRTFTVHHTEPGNPARVDTAVVACMSCNSSIRDDIDGSWARQHPMLPPPRKPFFDSHAARYLTEQGFPTEPSKGPAPDVKVAVAAATNTQEQTPFENKSPKKGIKSIYKSFSHPDKKGFAGSGREGSERDGSVREESGRDESVREGTGGLPPVVSQPDIPPPDFVVERCSEPSSVRPEKVNRSGVAPCCNETDSDLALLVDRSGIQQGLEDRTDKFLSRRRRRKSRRKGKVPDE